MSKIKGMEEIKTGAHLQQEINQGGKFVVYQYCISILVMTFKRSSGIYFIKSEENAVIKGLGFTLLTFLLGWWGIPWGPIYTIQSIIVNFQGGKDVTAEVFAALSNTAQAGAQ